MDESRSRREFLRSLAGVSVGAGLVAELGGCAGKSRAAGPPRAASDYAGALCAPKIDAVRLAFFGVGDRGSGHVERALTIDGVEVRAIADPHEAVALRARDACTKAGRPAPDLYTRGDHDYRRILERDDIDAVLISTPWRWHVPQAAQTMEAGKHAFVEVPLATTVEGCWELVEASERTRRHCMMMENVCYGRDELMFLNAVRVGAIGDLLHAEAAYIHDLRWQMKHVEHGTGSWRTDEHARRNGNLYPTHGLGPVAQYMSIDRGDDRFDTLVSMGTPALGRQRYAARSFPSDHVRNRARYVCGDLNTSLIRTARGRTILVQYDTTSPRPYTRHNLIQGTNGCLAGFPTRLAIEGQTDVHRWVEGAALAEWRTRFEHPLWTRMGAVARQRGGHGGMDFIMLSRMVECLRAGEPLDQNVYEGASWSVVSPLSEASVAAGGAPQAFPDFTRGRWRDTAPLAIV